MGDLCVMEPVGVGSEIWVRELWFGSGVVKFKKAKGKANVDLFILRISLVGFALLNDYEKGDFYSHSSLSCFALSRLLLVMRMRSISWLGEHSADCKWLDEVCYGQTSANR